MSLRSATRALTFVLGFFVLPMAEPARAADDPAGFISDLGRRAIEALTSSQSETDREARFRALFDEGFDVPVISRFVLGPYWRTASETQRQDFIKLFEAYVVHAYTVRFSDYSGQQLKVLSARAESDASSLVQSQIATPGGTAPPIKVDWRVNKIEKGFKITDVIVEGVSMAVTQRQEFASIIQRNGGQLDALLKLLRERAGQS